MDALTDYKMLLERFLSGELPAHKFQLMYLDAFKSEHRTLDEPLFAVLDELFGDVDSFTTECKLIARDPEFYLDEAQLREKVQHAVARLSALSGGDQIADPQNPIQ